jgi:glycosyltransferase involved in cell wall biosynthesis
LSRLRIAIVGSRGIPARWSGFETFAEELGVRLVELGHEVSVYCRSGYTGEELLDEYKGVRLIYSRYLRSRSLEKLSHEAFSVLDSLKRSFDLYYVLGAGATWLYGPIRASGSIVVINTDGLEWRRRKWNRAGRAYLKQAESVARFTADALVSDARGIQDYFMNEYGYRTKFLTNGAYVLNELPEGVLDEWGVTKGSYYLVACRIEPENNIDLIIEEFLRSGSGRELLIAGGMNYETPYWQHLQKLARRGRVRFLGPVYGPMLIEKLHLGCYAYLHGHEVGGTNPSLLKAMGCGNCAIALGSVFNVEVLGGTGLVWSKRPGSLAELLRWAEEHPDMLVEMGRKAQDRIREHYSWDQVARDHDLFFRELASLRASGALRSYTRWARLGEEPADG